MPIPAAELRGTLIHKFGFAPIGSGRGRHEKYRLVVNGEYVAHTQVSRGALELGEPLLGVIARQLGVTRKQLYEMIDCRLDLSGYLAAVQ